MAEAVERYSVTQIALHWVVAFLVIVNWALSSGMEEEIERRLDGAEVGTPLHVWLGLLILGLMVIRIAVRLRQPVPGAPEGTTGALATARHWGHILLYVLLFAVPLGGAATWFFGLENSPHPLAGNILMIVAVGHIVMALYHQGVKQDGTLIRMIKPRDG